MAKHRFSTTLALMGLLLAFHPEVNAFGAGAPGSPAICTSMLPSHGAAPQTSKSPYTSSISTINAKGGDTIKFTLTAPDGDFFKGFMVMVKKAGESKKAYGSFLPSKSSDVQSRDCFGSPNSAMTHTSGSEKKNIVLEWVAPNEDMTDLELVVTYVGQSFDKIWQAIPHNEKLTVKKNLNFVAPVAAKRISDDVRRKLKDAYDCAGKYCFGIPDGCVEAFESTKDNDDPTTCTALISWAVKGGDASKQESERYAYSLSGKYSGNSGYTAMGFSEDKDMGDDSIVGCFLNNGQVSVNRFVNPNRQDPNQIHQNPILGLVSRDKSAEEGYIFCNFDQESHNIDGKINVDLKTKSYYILLASGSNASPSGLGYHTNLKKASGEKASIYDVGVASSAPDTRLLYQLHGAFMIVAWLLCASTGMFTARYYKLTHTTVTPFNKAFWFVLHLFCMFATVFLTICGAVFIFVKKGAYVAKMGDDIMWHPVLGTILFGLALFQVLLAFCRPNPGTKRRPIFNWIHWTVGNSAHIIGIACIFLANDLKAANLEKDEYLFIMMGAVLFHIVMHLVMSFHTLWADKQMDTKSKRAVVPGPMKGNGVSGEAPGTGFRTFLLLLYFIGLLGCTVALVYYVCRPLNATLEKDE